MTKFWLVGVSALALVLGSATLPVVGAAQAADQAPSMGCGPEARIDGSTAADAKKKITAAGYTEVTGLKKGCDNFWHGRAIKDGVQTGVMLAPDGRVQSEGRGE